MWRPSLAGSRRSWLSCRCVTPAACCLPGTTWCTCRRRAAHGESRCTSTARASGSRSRGSITPCRECAALADSLYVSFYKGLDGLAGAALLGPAGLHRGGPAMAAPPGRHDCPHDGRSRFRAGRAPRPAAVLGDAVTWARAFAAELPSCITVQPGVPHTSQFLVFAAGDPDVVNERVLALIEERPSASPPGTRPGSRAGSPTDRGRRGAFGLDPAEVASLVGSVIEPREA